MQPLNRIAFWAVLMFVPLSVHARLYIEPGQGAAEAFVVPMSDAEMPAESAQSSYDATSDAEFAVGDVMLEGGSSASSGASSGATSQASRSESHHPASISTFGVAPVDRNVVKILSTQRSIAESIDAWAEEDGWEMVWDEAIPPIRPTRTTRYFGTVDHPDGALAMLLDRISPIVDLSAVIYRDERKIVIEPWRAPKWETQNFELTSPDGDLTLDY